MSKIPRHIFLDAAFESHAYDDKAFRIGAGQTISAPSTVANQSQLLDLNKGDKVVTIAGIHGTINKINDDGTVSLEINPGSYIKIEKSAISMEWTLQLQKNAGLATTEKKYV